MPVVLHYQLGSPIQPFSAHIIFFCSCEYFYFCFILYMGKFFFVVQLEIRIISRLIVLSKSFIIFTYLLTCVNLMDKGCNALNLEPNKIKLKQRSFEDFIGASFVLIDAGLLLIWMNNFQLCLLLHPALCLVLPANHMQCFDKFLFLSFPVSI